ncbi:MAG: DUF819 family protein [Desulfobacteraceae bacterium]|nr:DUF819 family protein [Desulfobacteraceae bacterium]
MAALIGFYLFFPVIVIWLCMRYSFFDKIGAVFICYIVGAGLGNSGLLPEAAKGLQDTLSGVSVAIALPLLLFSMDVRGWVKIAGKAILSMTLATITIVAMAGVGALLVMDHTTDSWKLTGLAVAVYTGGTPNMAAIKTALDVDPSTYIIMHTYDTVISLAYIIFCVTIAQKLMNKFLLPFKEETAQGRGDDPEVEDINSYENMFNKSTVKGLSIAFPLSLVILGTAVGLAALFPKEYSASITILLITTLGIGASFVSRIRNLEKTFQLGMYIILIFCLVVGSMADISVLIHINWILFFYISFCVFGTMILHAFLCRLFKVDTDTFIVTSIAAICSPPFVPAVAAALNNKQIILSGMTTGIIGYAVGNYLGISFAYIVKALMG